jgi:hypothetical protein
MNTNPPLTLEQAERLRELYRKCSVGLLLTPELLREVFPQQEPRPPVPWPPAASATRFPSPGGAR